MFPSRPDLSQIETLDLVFPSTNQRERIMDFLAYLTLAFDITAIRTLKCTFASPAYSNPVRMGHLTPDYRRLTRFIQRLHKITSIVIHFEKRNMFEYGTTPAGVYHDWLTSMNSLLDACRQSGCEEFRVYHGTYPTFYFFLYLRTALRSWIHLLANMGSKVTSIRQGPGWEYIPITSTAPITLSPSQILVDEKPKLDSFCIAAPFLLYPPHSEWTFQLLRASHLTTLTLLDISRITEAFWIPPFTWLAICLKSTLQTLTITRCLSLPPAPLIDFLNKFKSLTHLTLRGPLPLVHSLSRTLILPCLVSIFTYSDYITLMCPKRRFIRQPPLPQNLQNLRIIPRCPKDHNHSVDLVDCSSYYTTILTTFSKVPKIVLDFDSVTPRTSLNLPPPPGHLLHFPAYQHVTDIIVSAPQAYQDLCSPNVLSLFPNVKRVRILDRSIHQTQTHIPVEVLEKMKENLPRSVTAVTLVVGD
ncbi:hypothetical protein BDN72DRAFT_843515, partial [Pluteus cervinus]